MSGLAWAGLAIGLVIVAAAAGIPFFLTHKRVREPHDVSDSRAYLRERRKWAWRRRAAATSQSGAARSGRQN